MWWITACWMAASPRLPHPQGLKRPILLWTVLAIDNALPSQTVIPVLVEFPEHGLYRATHEILVDPLVERLAIHQQSLPDPLNGALYLLIPVGEAHHQGGHQETALDGLLEKEGPEGLGWLFVPIFGGVDQIARLAKKLKMVFELQLEHDGLDPPAQLAAGLPEAVNHVFFPVYLQGRHGSGEGVVLGTLRRGEEKDPLLVVGEPAQFHDV